MEGQIQQTAVDFQPHVNLWVSVYGALYLFITALCRELFFRIFYQCMYQHIDSA